MCEMLHELAEGYTKVSSIFDVVMGIVPLNRPASIVNVASTAVLLRIL